MYPKLPLGSSSIVRGSLHVFPPSIDDANTCRLRPFQLASGRSHQNIHSAALLGSRITVDGAAGLGSGLSFSSPHVAPSSVERASHSFLSVVRIVMYNDPSAH